MIHPEGVRTYLCINAKKEDSDENRVDATIHITLILRDTLGGIH